MLNIVHGTAINFTIGLLTFMMKRQRNLHDSNCIIKGGQEAKLTCDNKLTIVVTTS